MLIGSFLRASIVSIALALPCLAQQPISGTFIAGKVVDATTGESIGDVLVSVTARSRWLYDLRTSGNGWYESPHAIDIQSLREGIKITVIKAGYIPKSVKIQVPENILQALAEDNLQADELWREFYEQLYLDITLERAGIPIEYTPEFSLQTLDGYIGDDQGRPISGAKVQLFSERSIRDNVHGSNFSSARSYILDESYTRNSGYFTLNYGADLEEYRAIISATHPEYYGNHNFVNLGGDKGETDTRTTPRLSLQLAENRAWGVSIPFGFGNVYVDRDEESAIGVYT